MNCSIAFEKLIIRKAFYFRRFGKDREMFVGAEFHQYKGWSCNKSRLTEKQLLLAKLKKQHLSH